ncbi:MAG: baseplate J/gp47 family protein [Cyanobacteria bacterium P01_F01_bin.53]
MIACCPCDKLHHPRKPDIPAGLTALPRQLGEFSEYRLAMLREIPTYPPLADWRAREGNDLGIMLLEMWAYVLDILSFYDERIANESYLRTAVREASLYKLVGLIGYYPRPALASSVTLGAISEGKKPVILPPRTGFRSDAFGTEPPQIFETEFEQTIHPLLNEWTLDDVRDLSPPSGNFADLLLDLDTALVSPEQLVLLRSPNQLQPGRILTTDTITALDGNSYLNVTVDSSLSFATEPDTQLAEIELLRPERIATPNLMTNAAVVTFSSGSVRITLDSVYPEFADGEPVIIQRGKNLFATTVIHVDSTTVPVAAAFSETSSDFPLTDDASEEAPPPPRLPATTIMLEPELPGGWSLQPSRLRIHFQLVTAGVLTNTAKTRLAKADLESPGIPIEGLVEPFSENVPPPEQLLLQDDNDEGAQVDGTVQVTSQGQGRIVVDSDQPEFMPLLRTPVTAFGNLIRASRGESVLDEVLGSGDAAQAFQSFTLQNNPLTYSNDPAAPNGRRSTLSVRVNGLLWTEVSSFFGKGPQDEVYIARQSHEQETTITFGNGSTGSRLPTGIDNVTATYRFGAGAAKPPAGAIAQLSNPVEGLRRVVNPVAASGGADGDRPQDLRRNAPTSALLLGRAVSVQDFEALAREFGGVINARAEWAWDNTRQSAVVKVWFISDGGEIAQDLKVFLIGQADPTTPLVACAAIAYPTPLVLNVTINPRFTSEVVEEQIRLALTNEETGPLALTNIPIGRPLFRSRLFATILAIEGTCAVSAITVDGHPAPFAISVSEGHYRDFLSALTINVSLEGTPVNGPSVGSIARPLSEVLSI